MQNLIRHPQRQHVVSKRLIGFLFKCNSQKHGIINAAYTKKNFNNEMNRLCFSLSHSIYIDVHKELYMIQSSFLKDGSCKIYRTPRLFVARNFSTTPYLSNKDKNVESSKGSSDDNEKNSKKIRELQILYLKTGLLILILYCIIIAKGVELDSPWESYRFDWNDFVNEMLLKGEVEEIKIDYPQIIVQLRKGAIYKGKEYSSKSFVVQDPTYGKILEEKIREIERNIGIKSEDGVSIRYIHRNYELAISYLVLACIASYMFYRMRSRITKLPHIMDILSQHFKPKYTLIEPFSGKGVRFEDVAGLKEAKIEVMEFVDYLKQPERYKKLGGKIPKGVLLLGPPGCGKTLLAKAVATEANVPFLAINGSEFMEIVGGIGARRVRDLFSAAKERAPSIIYIDEIDAIGKKRSESTSGNISDNECDRTLNQLLVEMDGMTTREDVILLASTNRANVLDKALLRRGRFDRHILIDFPTLEERKQIFEYYLKSLSLRGKPEQYSGFLSYLTPGFSGADIANVCNEAALHAAREQKKVVDSNDLIYAIDRIIGGLTKKSSTLAPPTKRVVAYHEAGHALVGWLLEYTEALLKVTIIPRTNMSLGFAQYSTIDQKLHSKEELFQKICMMLGGRVAESLTFNKITTGAENDLKKITKMAYHQVQQFGMSPSVGLLSFDEESTSMNTKKPYSKKMANLMDAEVRRIIAEAYKTTEKLLLDNQDKLIMIAEALLKKETLTYDDLEKLIGPPPFGKKRLIEPADFISDI
ncbi:SPG7 matrix AAA peptidase subunit, paraplegin [Calliopsis andreniformis]|uniref:SPG7 matrix AAA peptidase subunit, paraplegin n=1 Tax=Calliopsis andreniformis TaxID=337506 RepID=UPI003FCD24EF